MRWWPNAHAVVPLLQWWLAYGCSWVRFPGLWRAAPLNEALDMCHQHIAAAHHVHSVQAHDAHCRAWHLVDYAGGITVHMAVYTGILPAPAAVLMVVCSSCSSHAPK